jgi:hypothetical protein
MSGPYGGHLGGDTSGGAQLGSAGAYKTTGGLNINPGRIAGGLLGSALGPLGSALGALAGGWASDQLGGNFNIGGTDNRIGAGLGIGGTATGGGWGSGGPGHMGSPGQNGGGQRGDPTPNTQRLSF